MTSNLELMRAAKAQLRGKWGMAALGTLIYMIIAMAVGGLGFGVGSLILGGPLMLGYVLFLITIHNGDQPDLDALFAGFKDFVRSMLTYILYTIFILLWTLLLIIPGIIMSIAYAMTFFIIAEDKDIRPLDAIRKSRDMMRGYKWRYFCLMLRFFGWFLLCGLTCGILWFWVGPYVQLASLNFYRELKNNQQ